MGNTQERRKSRRSSKQSTAQRSRDRLGTATSSLAETVQRSSHQRAPASGERSFRSDPDDILPGLDYSPEGIADQLRDMRIQRALDGTDTTRGEVPDTVLDVLGSGGQPLDGTIQRTLEDRMDADFSNVRIHTGAKAAEAADAIDAKAFTCGNDIVFNAGEYDPNSAEGQFLLAHELAHVTQQTGAAISMMPQEGADLEIDPDPKLEREADEAAMQALSGEEPATVQRLGTDVQIQKMDINAILPLIAAVPHLTPQLASLMQMYGPKVEEDLQEHKDLLENADEVDWMDATYEGAKEDAGRIPQLVTDLPGLKTIKETVNNAKEQRKEQREPTFQDKLEAATLPDSWKDELLEELKLSEELEQQITEAAKQAAKGATGAGDNVAGEGGHV